MEHRETRYSHIPLETNSNGKQPLTNSMTLGVGQNIDKAIYRRTYYCETRIDTLAPNIYTFNGTCSTQCSTGMPQIDILTRCSKQISQLRGTLLHCSSRWRSTHERGKLERNLTKDRNPACQSFFMDNLYS